MVTLFGRKYVCSTLGPRALVLSIVMVILLSILDGVVRGRSYSNGMDRVNLVMIQTWVSDFRFLFEQGLYAATIFFIGAKFLETRTLISIGYETIDAQKMRCRGPDEENIVWIGKAYDNSLEAETVVSAINDRSRSSGAAVMEPHKDPSGIIIGSED